MLYYSLHHSAEIVLSKTDRIRLLVCYGTQFVPKAFGSPQWLSRLARRTYKQYLRNAKVGSSILPWGTAFFFLFRQRN